MRDSSHRFGGVLLAAVLGLALLAGFGPAAASTDPTMTAFSIDLAAHSGAAPPLMGADLALSSSSLSGAVAPELLADSPGISCMAPTGEHSSGIRLGLPGGSFAVFHGMATAPPAAHDSA